MRYLSGRVGWVILIFAAAAGCNQNKGPIRHTQRPYRPPTEAEAKEFAKKIEDAVAKKRPQAFRELLDWEWMLERATEGMKLTKQDYEEMRRGFLDAAISRSGLGEGIIRATASGGSYKLLRLVSEGKKKYALFRLDMGEQGFNYHRMLLGKVDGGKVRGLDVEIFVSGEWLSESFRRMLLPFVAHRNRSLAERLRGKDRDYIKRFEELQAMIRAVTQGQPRRALAIYRELPENVQKMKFALLFRIQAALALDDRKEYEEAFKTLKRQFPNDPAVDMAAIDYHSFREEWDLAVQAVDRLDKRVGGDPMLKSVKAGLRRQQRRSR